MPLYIVSNSLVLLPFALCIHHKHCFLRVKQPAELQKNCTKNAPQFTILRSEIKKILGKGAVPPPQNFFWFWISKLRFVVHSWCNFFAVQLQLWGGEKILSPKYIFTGGQSPPRPRDRRHWMSWSLNRSQCISNNLATEECRVRMRDRARRCKQSKCSVGELVTNYYWIFYRFNIQCITW